MPQFESEYEEKLYNDRAESLRRIGEIGQRLGLSAAEAIYPNSFTFVPKDITIPKLRALGLNADGSEKSGEALEAEPIEVAIAGRIMAHRAQGKAGFAQLQGGGERIQIYVRKDDVGRTPEESQDVFELYKALHIGDHIGVRGTLMRTRTGELTLKAHSIASQTGADGKPLPAISFLAKAMLALPDKYHGLEDVELRYRQRYVDLIMNSGTKPDAGAAATPAESASSLLSSRSAAEGSASPITNSSSRPESSQSEDAAGRPASPPGSSSVTEVSADNEQHNDALKDQRNVREVFVKRAAILRAIRKFFDERGYLEVETPMLHTIAGGAAARPFGTHHNALNIPLSLRIAPELYLKRLVVGGLDRVYEINRNFRNEGVSTRHNPEFTMLEFYQAYANYYDLMELTQQLIMQIAMEVNGTTVTRFNGDEIDLSKWTMLTMREAIIKFWPEELGTQPTCDDLVDAASLKYLLDSALDVLGAPTSVLEISADLSGLPLAIGPAEPHRRRLRNMFTVISHKLDRQGNNHYGKAVADTFETVAEEHLIQPTIIYDFPLAVSPLSKVKPDDPEWVERFEFYIGGFEVGNAFSELNDAADQEARFEAQVSDKDPESMAAVDEDYVRALGYGLPPTAGEGIGIDRLTMLLTGSRSIRDVILFPLMRPLTGNKDTSE